MSGAIRYEVQLFLASLATGAGLMAVYDLVCVFRLICPHSDLAVGAEDFLYGIYSAVMTFGMLYELNNGALRGYAIGGTVLGMVIYQRFIGSILLKYLKKGQEYFRIRIKMHRRRKKKVER